MITDTLGSGARPCADCGTPMEADQRYCLGCGTRSADARLAFRDILGRPAPAAAITAVSAGSPRAAVPVAGVGLLLLAMLIGVLIGSRFGSGDDLAKALAAQKPQVVQVGNVAPAPAAVPTTEAPAGGGSTRKVTSSPSGKPKDKTSTHPAKATNTAVENLDKLSGKAYQKQIDKLGKNIPTGGAAPPKDNKPAAGGGTFEEIG